MDPQETNQDSAIVNASKHTHWLNLARSLNWTLFPQKTDHSHFGKEAVISWYEDGLLNMAANCLDRHAALSGDKIALIGVGNEDGQYKKLSYKELLAEVKIAANILKMMGIKKGDRVAIFLPTIPEAAIFMLACARIGAIHVVLFGGLSSQALEHRLRDASPSLLITLTKSRRGLKELDFLNVAQNALSQLEDMHTIKVLLVDSGLETDLKLSDHYVIYEKLRPLVPAECSFVPVKATDPLFILYTSGTTGTPKGIIHSTGGYACWVHDTFKRVFSPLENDIFWSTADIGWITGHSYTIYAPLLHGLTTVLYEGMPTYPTAERWWQIIAKLGVTIFYTAPTALRMLSSEPNGCPREGMTKSIRLLGSVGEPLDASSWNWFHHYVGHSSCPLLDTWWQTETGGIMLSPPMENNEKSDPHLGLEAPECLEITLLDDNGAEVKNAGIGALCFKTSWPGQAIGIWRHKEIFQKTYFTPYPGYYLSGDEVERTAEGYYRILGRIDDVVNISGHRVSSAEIEEIMLAQDSVRECAAIGIPHGLKGQCIALFIVPDHKASLTRESVLSCITKGIGSYARPDYIEFCHSLPKTSSGKIARSVLKKQITEQAKNDHVTNCR